MTSELWELSQQLCKCVNGANQKPCTCQRKLAPFVLVVPFQAKYGVCQYWYWHWNECSNKEWSENFACPFILDMYYQVCGVWVCILVLSRHIFGRSGEDRELIAVCMYLSLPLSHTHTPYIYISKAVQNIMLINHWFIYNIPKFTLANSWRLQRIRLSRIKTRQFLLFWLYKKKKRVVWVDHPWVSPQNLCEACASFVLVWRLCLHELRNQYSQLLRHFPLQCELVPSITRTQSRR